MQTYLNGIIKRVPPLKWTVRFPEQQDVEFVYNTTNSEFVTVMLYCLLSVQPDQSTVVTFSAVSICTLEHVWQPFT